MGNCPQSNGKKIFVISRKKDNGNFHLWKHNTKSILQSKGEEAARAYLTDYTADFIGATILRWDEMANQYWIESRFGF